MKPQQLAFTTILNDAFAQYERQIVAYMAKNKSKYLSFAQFITPDYASDTAIYSRIAFAILSANAPFDDSVKALDVVMQKRGRVTANDIAWFKMVPAKAKWLNTLSRKDMFAFLLMADEPWHDYRLRLRRDIKGLGLAKASFAAALLYPLEADIACIDTWIQKVFLGNSGFKSLSVRDYLLVESKIRTYANCFGISTFLAQWMIWDHARGNGASNHAIFPGSHKD